jgi:hypothetical protein
MTHSRVRGAYGPQSVFSTAADNDLIAHAMKGLGEPFSDARRAAGDENGVGMHFHEKFPYNP